jgi:signal recognition particle receptor subunit beta
MASINYAAREISVKVVYYGPGLSGKTTNLQVIHRKVPPEYKSDMVSLATETDRTLFFDFLPLDLGKIKGFSTKFQLYTVPGQVYYNATRKLVLRGVDGIVFVADSAPDKMQENVESFQNLEENLAEYGYKRENIPIIIQYNKRDLPNAVAVEELQRIVNKYNLPWTEAVANKGKGVFDSLKLIGKIVIDHLNKKYSRQTSRPTSMNQMAGSVTAASSSYNQIPRQQQPFAPATQSPFAGNQSGSYQQKPAQPFAHRPVRPAAAPQMPVNRSSQVPPTVPLQPNSRQMPPQFQQMPPRVPPVQMPRPNQHQFQPPYQMRPAPAQQPIRPVTPQPPKQPLKSPHSQQVPPYQQEETFEVSFEPNSAGSASRFTPPQQSDPSTQDYFNYGNVNFQHSVDQGYDASNQQQISNNSFNTPGPGKTDLDLEIEKYQREIEERQRRMRAQSQNSGYQQSMPAEQPPAQPFSQQSSDDDYDVYNLELPSYPMQGPTQRQPAISDELSDETMYFTSVDTDRQKRPVKRPVNPRNKPQKGFLSKFFNKDVP